MRDPLFKRNLMVVGSKQKDSLSKRVKDDIKETEKEAFKKIDKRKNPQKEMNKITKEKKKEKDKNKTKTKKVSKEKVLREIESVLRQFKFDPYRSGENREIIIIEGIDIGSFLGKLKNNGWQIIQTLPDKENQKVDMKFKTHRISVVQRMHRHENPPIAIFIKRLGNQGIGESVSVEDAREGGSVFTMRA